MVRVRHSVTKGSTLMFRIAKVQEGTSDGARITLREDRWDADDESHPSFVTIL